MVIKTAGRVAALSAPWNPLDGIGAFGFRRVLHVGFRRRSG